MYKYAVTSYVMRNSLPSPEYTGDSDSDTEIIQELEQKRRQLDEDIARFKAQKDKEFREFESDLRTRRKNKKSHSISDQRALHAFNTSITPPSQTGFREIVGVSSQSNSGTMRRSIQPRRLMKSDFGAKATSPTLCLDKLNIAGENTLAQHQPHTPPTPSLLTKISSQSSLESLAKSSSQESTQNVNGNEQGSSRSGMFDPSYLPILEAKLTDTQYSSATRPLTESHTEPTSPNGSLNICAPELQSSSLPSESHVSDEFHIHAAKRAYTAPSGLRRNPLAPIIHTGSNRKHTARKRKRVTFQLADRAIVDPSSSYEEGPSPSLESDKGSESGSSTRSGSLSPSLGGRRKTPRDQFGRKISDEKKSNTKHEQVGMGMGDLLMASVQEETEEEDGIAGKQEKMADEAEGYFSPKHSQSPNGVPIYASEYSPASSEDLDILAKSNSFDRVDDDRYLQERKDKLRSGKPNITTSSPISPVARNSPRFLPQQTQPRTDLETPVDIDNPAGNVGFFELDEELTSPGADEPKPFNEDIEDTLAGEEDEEVLEIKQNKHFSEARHRGMNTGFAAGSVPIDIVRPGWSSLQGSLTNSWIGTFGH